MKKTLTIILAVLIFSALILEGCGKKQEKSITLGSKSFTEGYILSNMVSQMLQDNGFNVKENFGMNTYIIRKALLSKQLDAYVEYTGTGWAVHLNEKRVIRDPEKLFEAVKNEDLQKNNIAWIDRINFNDTYALAIRKNDIAKYGESLSSLANYVNTHPGKTIFAIDHEFYQRPDGFPQMTDFYGMNTGKNQIKTMDIGITYVALSKGQVDVAMVYSTDGLLKKYNLYVLKDNKNFFPIYNPALSIREETLKKYPEIEKILEPLTKTLTADDMINLNYLVDAEGKNPKDVAIQYLKDKGLIKKSH